MGQGGRAGECQQDHRYLCICRVVTVPTHASRCPSPTMPAVNTRASELGHGINDVGLIFFPETKKSKQYLNQLFPNMLLLFWQLTLFYFLTQTKWFLMMMLIVNCVSFFVWTSVAHHQLSLPIFLWPISQASSDLMVFWHGHWSSVYLNYFQWDTSQDFVSRIHLGVHQVHVLGR